MSEDISFKYFQLPDLICPCDTRLTQGSIKLDHQLHVDDLFYGDASVQSGLVGGTIPLQTGGCWAHDAGCHCHHHNPAIGACSPDTSINWNWTQAPERRWGRTMNTGRWRVPRGWMRAYRSVTGGHRCDPPWWRSKLAGQRLEGPRLAWPEPVSWTLESSVRKESVKLSHESLTQHVSSSAQQEAWSLVNEICRVLSLCLVFSSHVFEAL